MADGYVAIGAQGDDLRFIVLTQTQMDEVDAELKTNGNRITEAVNTITERHKLYDDATFYTMKETIAYMISQGLVLEEDFVFCDY